MVATPERVLVTRSVRRIPIEERWGRDTLDWVKWAPWKWHAEAEDEGDLPEGVPLEEKGSVKASGDRVFLLT